METIKRKISSIKIQELIDKINPYGLGPEVEMTEECHPLLEHVCNLFSYIKEDKYCRNEKFLWIRGNEVPKGI